LSDAIAARYSELRRRLPALEKGDALIAATALVRQLPLLTKNKRHFEMVKELALFGE
jgi:predicted nucleic acid-binding protein